MRVERGVRGGNGGGCRHLRAAAGCGEPPGKCIAVTCRRRQSAVCPCCITPCRGRHRATVGVEGDRHALHGANRKPEVAVVAVLVVAARIAIKAPCVVFVVVRVRAGRPVDAVRTGIDERSPATVAGAGVYTYSICLFSLLVKHILQNISGVMKIVFSQE